MNSGIALGRLFGTEIRIHWTWIPVLAVLCVFFGMGLDSEAGPQWPVGLSWATAIVTAVLVFASVVLHELAHVAIARRSGIGGNVVVVQLLGGTYVMDLRASTPGEQFRAAAAGPVVSAVVVIVSGVVVAVASVGNGSSATGSSWLQALDFAAFTLGLFNVFLILVNLVPGYPLDGGQLVHALAWRRTGDRRKANGTVSRVGRFFGFVLLLLGAGLSVEVDLLPGLGLMVAGWVLLSSSRMLERRGFLQSLTTGLLVRDAIDPDSARVPPQLTLDVFAPEYMGARLGGAALVESGGQLLGLIGQAQIRRVPKRNWPTTRTENVMVPLENVPRVNPDAELWPNLELLERSGQDALLVGPGEPEVQLMTRRSAARLIQERAQEQVRLKKIADGLAGLSRRRGPGGLMRRAGPDVPPEPPGSAPGSASGSAASGDAAPPEEPPDQAPARQDDEQERR
jgi:Zn-dependent protease